MANIEHLLVRHLSDISFNNLPATAIDDCKKLIIDTIGVCLPGTKAPGIGEIIKLIREWGNQTGSSVLFHHFRAAPPLAALANGAMMHACDFDDTLDESALHTFVTVLPSALATVESVGKVTGKEFISALVLGVDIISRISLGINRPLSWIRTSTCGSFGAAATASKLLQLNPEQISNALGIVYSQTAGNAQGLIESRLVKRLQPGFAAQAGVSSAFLALHGITGSQAFLEGDYGYYHLYERGDYNPEPVIEDLGKRFYVSDLSIKPYPCCRMTHSSIDGALESREKMAGDLEQIEQIIVSVSSMVAQMVGKPFVIGDNPQVDAQFSIPYTVSVALYNGDVFLKDFIEENIENKKITDLAKKVKIIVDPDLPDKDLNYSNIVVHLQNGHLIETTIKIPLGNPAKPMSLEQCQEKFRKCLKESKVDFSESRIEKLFSMINNLEALEDMREFISLLNYY